MWETSRGGSPVAVGSRYGAGAVGPVPAFSGGFACGCFGLRPVDAKGFSRAGNPWG